MSEGVHPRVLGVVFCLCAISSCFAQILTPPSFNLAKGRPITATATCGVGISSPELYCHLTGTEGGPLDHDSIQIQGQLCDYCDPTNPSRNHSAYNAIDGTEKFWQSPPLSRGDEFNEINIQIPLGQEFFIAYIFIKMGKSPRPGVWALEKSVDYGETWEPWQFFADSDHDCNRFFQTKANQPLTKDDQILCVTGFSRIVPLTDGEILVSLTNSRPNAYNFSHADDLKEFMRATDVRIRLIRTRTLLGHLMAVANQDPTVTRRYFYSVRDISIGGRCVCNGHADTCSYLDPLRPNFLVCDCQHNTIGDQCELCDEDRGYVQKKWQPARVNTPFECEPCQCFGRATACKYDPEVDANKESLDIHGFFNGGGVCQNCAYNSTGNNCEKCVAGFHRPFGVPYTELYMCEPCSCDPQFHINECEDDTGRCLCKEGYTGYNCDECSVGYYGFPYCIPCDCDINGTEGDVCQVGGGQCPCKDSYVGAKCDMCQMGFFDFPWCARCECDAIGSADQFCDVDSGQCKCEMNYASRNCSMCANGYFSFPDCALCSCDPYGTEEEICNKETGECLCKETFSGEMCDSCARGYYAYPDCMPCMCREPGSTSNICQDRSGQCACQANYAGQNCERCAAGFYKYPDCVPCNCDSYGSLGESCEQETGQCDCKYNFQGLMCSKCKEGLYNYPNCEECNCNPAGARQIPGYPLGGCGEETRGLLCECKAKVTGRICDTCFQGYWNLNRNNPDGCEACSCSDAGTIAGMNMCNMITGQCVCKVDVGGRNCDTCQNGYYNLHKQNLFGCVECDCDIGGSESLVCNKETGQCPCKPRVEGKRCDLAIQQHFIPNLDQLKFEIEDGYTPEGNPVRYGFDDRLFPNFSWKGYAILTPLQNEVRQDVEVYKPSIYRVIYRYINLNEDTVKGNVTWSRQDRPDEPIQSGTVKFAPTSVPAFSSVSDFGGNFGYVLNPGRWTMAIKTDQNVFLDYMILIPQAYFEATVLQTQVFRPCLTPDDAGPCLHYSYPEVLDNPWVSGKTGYVVDGDGNRIPVDLFKNEVILEELGIDSMAVLTTDQQSFYMNLYIPKTDKYVLVLNYYSDANITQNLLFNIGNDTQATAVIYKCQYSSLCRQVLLGLDEMEGVFDMEEGYHEIKVQGEEGISAGIESIVAIPYHIWTIRYIRPSIVCIRINGVCVGSRYATPIGSVKIEFEALPNDHLLSESLPPSLPPDSDIGLVLLNTTQRLIVLLGQAKDTGLHKFLVHYYLPYDTGSEIPVVLYANGQEYKGVFRPRFCPTINGCRDLIYFEESGQSGNINLLTTDVKVVFNNTSGQDIWLDYMLLIPSGQYTPNNIVLQPVDNSRNFIDVCVDEGYKIKTPLTDFCEKSLFTLTTEFNNGALECECNIDGSLNFNCDRNGGQCNCRPNVIGRTCSACRVGYYGFPRCMPCNCPFGLCHQLTGQCICPPRVTGDRCDVCEPGTYGYDALIGCQECNCSPQGVVGGDINCDEDTGQCSCAAGIGGRKCDYCLAGYYAFPQCRECECDRFGTTEDICDVNTAQCMCKENVEGGRCDQCAAFTFNLDEANPKGCTSCFCFGTTAKCQASTLSWDLITDMVGWNLTNIVDAEVREAGTVVALLEAVDNTANTSRSMYWTAPQAYLGNKVTSYGGYLHYKVLFVLSRNESVETEALVGEPDVILVGGNGQTIIHKASSQPFNSAFTDMEVQLIEYNFMHTDSELRGTTVDRETMMMILLQLQAIHIRGSYYSVVEELRLREVEMDYASEMGLGEPALSVEQCLCPRGYVGSSCEDCAAGYYRARTYPYLGVCLPCECNGHAETCDINTGECNNCQNNTMGPHCDQCLPGYMGTGYLGLETTAGCTICGCPLNVESNNFADTCSLRAYGTGEVRTVCDCYPGYAGSRCERCSPGFYGDPMEVGSTCMNCECSGNIDMNDADSCDYQTGTCVHCINSTGVRCERCKEWMYGDAVVAKNCFPCSCSKCGSVSCNTQQGQCTCKPNVIGINCDRCAPDYYGFEACEGCYPCECAEASVDSQCDMYNGTCLCQPGVTGHKCDSCISGFWNYQDTGCEKCFCDFEGAVTCDPVSGQCQCLPGVTGAQCDTCLDRWVLVPQEGCRECDECTHYLMDDIEYMDNNITAVQVGLQTVSIGVYAMQRLDAANESVAMYQPMVDALLDNTENITLEPTEKSLEQWSTITNNILARTTNFLTSAEGIVEDGEALAEKSEAAVALGDMSDKKAKDAILYIKEILRQINEGIRVTNIETYISLVEQSMEKIRMSNYTAQNDSVAEELVEAEELLAQIKEDQMTPKDLMMATEISMTNLLTVEESLKDLQENSQKAESVALSAMGKIDKLNEDTVVAIESHVGGIEIGEEMTLDTIEASNDILDDSQAFNNDSVREFKLLDQTSANMEQAKAIMIEFFKKYDKMERAEAAVNESWVHASELQMQADLLENVYTDTRDVASNAVDAGRAYENIVAALENARTAAELAVIAANTAKLQSGGVGDVSKNMTKSSEMLLMGAKASYNSTQIDLVGRLTYALAGTQQIVNMNSNVQKAKNQLDMTVKKLSVGRAGNQSVVVMGKSGVSVNQAEDAIGGIQGILAALPMELDKTGPLVTRVINFSKDINMAKTQVNNVQKSIPEITKLLTDVQGQSETVKKLGRQVTTNLADLREKIAIARNQANLIRVGLKFVGNTTATLRNPPNVAQAGSYNKVSLFFKTTAANGLLLYAGSPRSGTGQPNQDYMAIELENGNVVFKFNLGNGLAKLNHPHYVSDGKWYKVTAKRIGKMGTLTLERDPTLATLEPVHGKASGLSSVLEMHPLTTRFYVGGIPAGASISEDVTSVNYEGVMESVEFDDSPMGLWNFEAGENNYMGARERNILTSIFSNGFRFDGSGYVILSTAALGWKPAVKSQVALRMKTYAENGLLFYASDKERDFLSIEVNNGKILFQFDLGGGRVELRSQTLVNDGEWHDIRVSRLNKTGIMKVDEETVDKVDAPGSLTQLSITDDISIGGYQDIILPTTGVTKQGFEGCIEDVALELTTWDLNDNKKSKGVIPGCPDQIARVATFTAEQLSYVAKPMDSIGANFDLTFKMKTKKNTALLLFAGHTELVLGFSVSVVNGMVAVVSNAGGERIELMSRVNTYNDGRWHYISIMKMGLKLMMNIDDYEIVQGEGEGSMKRLETNTPLYFGTPDVPVPKDVSPVSDIFDGCIGDVTINGEFLNFASIPSAARPGASLSGCPIPDPEGPYEREKISTQYPPFEWPSTTTTEAPMLIKDRCALAATMPEEVAEGDLKGLYFGAYPTSRIEFSSLPSSLRIRSAISLDFRTTEANGVIMYFTDSKGTDHIAIVMQDGKIRYTFNSGTGPGIIISRKSYDDGKWHMLEIGRNLKEGSMQVDGDLVETTKSQGRARSINVKAPYYIGGVDVELIGRNGAKNLDDVTSSFKGCLANIKLDGQDVGEPPVNNGTIPCSDLTEVGAYFYDNGGFIQLIDAFKVGMNFEASLEIRPRSMSGVIFSVHGSKGDFILLQMIDGQLEFRADNGAGPIIATFIPEMQNKLCDGTWHKIKATKTKNVVILQVDNGEEIVTTSSGSASSADTNNPFYLGGKPDAITKGVKATDSYLGCLRNLFINGQSQYLTTGVAFASVSVENCPVN